MTDEEISYEAASAWERHGQQFELAKIDRRNEMTSMVHQAQLAAKEAKHAAQVQIEGIRGQVELAREQVRQMASVSIARENANARAVDSISRSRQGNATETLHAHVFNVRPEARRVVTRETRCGFTTVPAGGVRGLFGAVDQLPYFHDRIVDTAFE